MAMAATASTSASGSGEQPNTSLYIKNLNTKVKKPEMRRQLYTLFSTYGPLLSIIATRSESMRGQAFVVFRDLAHATAARRALDGFEFYERGMRIEYARSKSKATLLEERGAEGVWEVQAQLAKGKEGAAANGKVTFSSAGAERVGRERKRAREEARERGEKGGESSEEEESSDEEDEKPAKAAKVAAENGDGQQAPSAPAAADGAEEDDEDEMDMADSDDDSDAGPKPPPAP